MRFAVYIFILGMLISLLPVDINAEPPHSVECLYDSVYLNIDDDYTAEMTIHRKYRFDQPGNSRYSSLREPVNKYVEFIFEKMIYEMPDGSVIKFSEGDIETVPDYGPGYYPDRKSKRLRLPFSRPGATAEVAYKLKYKNLLYLPQMIRQYDIPVGSSYLVVKSDIPFEYYVSRDCFEVSLEDKSLVIEAENIKPYILETAMPAVSNYRIIIKPETIKFNDQFYSFNNWSAVADFYNSISQVSYSPDSNLTNFAGSLCADATSFSDSLEMLFDYVRDNIRYISVDLGRGDFQPLPAFEVNQKKYGDCKDQTSLLIALCRAVNINADPALITTRERPPVIIDLPWHGYFDHAITAIDTTGGFIFLDASSQTCCFGSLPPKLRNQKALICGNESFLDFTLTSAYQPANRISIDLRYYIEPDGAYRCSFDLEFFDDPAFAFYSKNPENTLTEIIAAMFDLAYSKERYPGIMISAFEPDYINIEGLYFGESAANRQDGRLLFNYKSPLLKYLKRYFKTNDRLNPYVFDFTFNIDERLLLEIPEGCTVEKDTLALNFQGKGIKAEMYLADDADGCRNFKNFRVIDYNLSSDRYNRFSDFLLTASRTPYNSIVIECKDERENRR